MKFIKLYEDFTYYQQLDVDDFDNHIVDEFLDPKEDLQEFNEKEINTIKNYINKKFIKYNINFTQKSRSLLSDQIRDDGVTNFGRNEIVQLCFNIKDMTTHDDGDFDYNSIIVYKLPDEWYMISIYGYGQYKCDQIDGLYKFIDDYSKDYNDFTIDEISESIKFGDGLKSNIFYQSITRDEFTNYLFDEDMNTIENPKFSEIEINTIHNFFIGLRGIEIRSLGVQFKNKNLRIDIGSDTIMIYKLPDEWFLITSLKANYQFKCDQLDGLFKCLNDFKKIIMTTNESYLKLYENINFYTQIDSEEFNDNYDFTRKGIIEISESEKKKIEKYIPDMSYSVNVKYNEMPPFSWSYIRPHIYKTDNKVSIIIYKNSDEWFYVEFKATSLLFRQRWNTEYYKCDQLDGLIEVLKKLTEKQKVNENFKEKLFTEMTEDEWENYGECTKPEDFTKEELLIISDIKFNFKIYISGPLGPLSQYPNNKGLYSIDIENDIQTKKTVRLRFSIYKNSDEWFFIQDYDHKRFYKCDTLDGVLECFDYINDYFFI